MTRPEDARCETCPWLHERTVLFQSPRDGLMHKRRGLFCKRFPEEIEKDADDFCGEHPAFARRIPLGDSNE